MVEKKLESTLFLTELLHCWRISVVKRRVTDIYICLYSTLSKTPKPSRAKSKSEVALHQKSVLRAHLVILWAGKNLFQEGVAHKRLEHA